MTLALGRYRSPSRPVHPLRFVATRGTTTNVATLEPRSREVQWPLGGTVVEANLFARVHFTRYGEPVGYEGNSYRVAATTTTFANIAGIDALGLDRDAARVRALVMTATDLIIAEAAHGAGPLNAGVVSQLPRPAGTQNIITAEFSPDARKLAVLVWADARASATNGIDWAIESQSEVVLLEAVRAANGTWAWTQIERAPEPLRDDVTVIHHFVYTDPGGATPDVVSGIAEHVLGGNRPLGAGYDSAGTLRIARLAASGSYYSEGFFVGADPGTGNPVAAYWIPTTGAAPAGGATAQVLARLDTGVELALFADTSSVVLSNAFPRSNRAVRDGVRRFALPRGLDAGRRVAAAWEAERTYSQGAVNAWQQELAPRSALRSRHFDGTARDAPWQAGAAFSPDALTDNPAASLDLNNGDQGTTDARAFPYLRNLLRSDLRVLDNRLQTDAYARWMAAERLERNGTGYVGVLTSHGEQRRAPLGATEALTGVGYGIA